MNTTLVAALAGLTVYLLALLWLGAKSGSDQNNNADRYFLADRSLKAGLLFFTLIATNFSAFFFLGFAGAGYRIGIAYYPMMALGTGLAALSFGSLGCRVRTLSREHGLITPSELIGHLLPGEGPRLLVLLVMVLFTLPYLALQPLGAGYLLESLTGGAVPFGVGAVLLTVVIVLYVVGGALFFDDVPTLSSAALIVPLTLLLVVVCGTLLGSVLPLVFERIGLDPAMMSNPFVAGIIDIVGIVIYVNVAILLLGSPLQA